MSIDPQLFNLVMSLREDRRRQEERAEAQRQQGLQTGLSFAEAGQLTPEVASTFGVPQEDLSLLLGAQERMQQERTGAKILPDLPGIALGIEQGLAPEASLPFSQQIAQLTPAQQEQLGIGITAERTKRRTDLLADIQKEMAAKDLKTFESGLRREEETFKQQNRIGLKELGYKHQAELQGTTEYMNAKAIEISENPALLQDEAWKSSLAEELYGTYGEAAPAIAGKIDSMAHAKMLRELSVQDHVDAGATQRLAKLALKGEAHRDKLLGRYYEGSAAVRDRQDARAGLAEATQRYELATEELARLGGGFIGQGTIEDLKKRLGPEGNAAFAQFDAARTELKAQIAFAAGGQQLTEHEIKLRTASILTDAQVAFVNGELSPSVRARLNAVRGFNESTYLQVFSPEERREARAQYRSREQAIREELRNDFVLKTETLRNPEGNALADSLFPELTAPQPTQPTAPLAPTEPPGMSPEAFETNQMLQEESGFPAFQPQTIPGQVPSRAREIEAFERQQRLGGQVPPEQMRVR